MSDSQVIESINGIGTDEKYPNWLYECIVFHPVVFLDLGLMVSAVRSEPQLKENKNILSSLQNKIFYLIYGRIY